jgi:DNA-binding transcriptional ArsR family regulator
VSKPRPSLLPLLRSENQLRLLAALFLAPQASWTVSGLARQTGVPQPSASREIARLAEAGLVVAQEKSGRREVRANVDSVIYPELRSMLLKTVGPKPVLEDALSGLAGVQAAYIYGSWARRYHGQPGAEPHDIDLLVVGEPDVDSLNSLLEQAIDTLGRDVNPTVITEDEWAATTDEQLNDSSVSGFLRGLRQSPLVSLDIS